MNKHKLIIAVIVLFAASLACEAYPDDESGATPTPSETPLPTATSTATAVPIPTEPEPEELITPTQPATSIPDTVIEELQPSGLIDTGGIILASTTLVTDTGNHVGGGFLTLANPISLTITTTLQTSPALVEGLDLLDQGGVEYEPAGTYWELTGADTFVNVAGILDENGNYQAAGKGEVAGFSDVSVYLDAKITDNTLVGEYWMGWLGELPGGEASVFLVEGMKIDSTNVVTAPIGIDAVNGFADEFSEAVRTQNKIFLSDRLADISIEKYGEPACQATIEALNDPTFDIQVNEFSGPNDWTWERDGFTVVVPNALTIQADVTSQGATNPTELHFIFGDDGLLRWVTDCGDPLQ